MRAYKITFDRSAFHGNNFDLLSKSPLPRVISNSKLTVFHSPVFLEETIRLHRKNPDELRKQLPFILEICNGGWFLERQLLWHQELIQHRCEKTNPVTSPRKKSEHEASIRSFGIDGKTDHFPYDEALKEEELRYKHTPWSQGRISQDAK